MRITSKGQVTIPHHVRRELGLKPGDEVESVVQGGVAMILPTSGPSECGERIVEAMWGQGGVDLTTDEIMALTRGD